MKESVPYLKQKQQQQKIILCTVCYPKRIMAHGKTGGAIEKSNGALSLALVVHAHKATSWGVKGKANNLQRENSYAIS